MSMARSPRINAAPASLRLAFLLNLGFTLLEILGGVLTNSLAIISGAVHDLGDTLSLGLAWHLDKYAEKESDRWYSYGYRRFSLLGALVTAFGMTVGSVVVLSEVVPRLLQPGHPKAGGMAFLAVVGIVVNGLAAVRVKGGRTLNARLVTWHLLGDVLGWVAVLSVSIVLLFKDAPILDPILAILITSYVLFNVLKNLKKIVQLFLQSVPGTVDIGEIEKRLLAIDKVKSVHHTHVWSLDGEHNVLTTHLVVEASATKEELLRIRNQVRLLLENTDFEHTTVEIGYENEYCRMKET
jgi:cobalt-zinc-cadmium efflux system protein